MNVVVVVGNAGMTIVLVVVTVLLETTPVVVEMVTCGDWTKVSEAAPGDGNGLGFQMTEVKEPLPWPPGLAPTFPPPSPGSEVT